MKLKKAGLLTKLLIVAMVAYACYTIITVRTHTAEAENQLNSLTKQVEQAQQENARLEYEIEHSTDPETIEEIAREKLGLVKPGEKIFYDIGH